MNKDKRIPEPPKHLQRFPCMYPWIGENYCKGDTRIAVVCESHFLPFGVTRLNHDANAESWYQSRQDEIPYCHKTVDGREIDVHSYMNTCHCVDRHRKNRDASGNATYSRIEELLSFTNIAFFNYIFRPAEESEKGCSRGYSHRDWNFGKADCCVSESILRWFIKAYKPTAIIFASSIVEKWTNVCKIMQEYRDIACCMTYHPTACNGRVFLCETRKFLSQVSGCAGA